MATLKIAMDNKYCIGYTCEVWKTFVLSISNDALPSNLYSIIFSLLPSLENTTIEDSTKSNIVKIFQFLIIEKYDLLRQQLRLMYICYTTIISLGITLHLNILSLF